MLGYKVRHEGFFARRALRFGGLCGMASVLFSGAALADPENSDTEKNKNSIYIVKGMRSPYDAAHSPTQPGVPKFVPAPNGGDGSAIVTKTGVYSTLSQPYLFSLQFNSVENVGKKLSDYGVYFNGWNISQLNANVGGGYKTGSAYTNWALVGLNLDMRRIAGIPGAQIHFIIDDVAGQGRSWEYNASDWSWINTWGNHDGLQVREFTWDQELFNKHLFILAGRSNPKVENSKGQNYIVSLLRFSVRLLQLLRLMDHPHLLRLLRGARVC